MAGGTRIHKHAEAIGVLLLCPTIAEAAKQLGIGDRTLRRWMHTEPFRTAYLEARQQVMSEAIASLQKAAAKAVESLLDKLNDPDESSAIQVAAARAILEYSFRGADREGLLYRQGPHEARGAYEWAADEDVEAFEDE